MSTSMTDGTATELFGDSAMGRVMCTVDWSATSLGPVEHWPQSLRMMVRFILANRMPMLLWWGPEYTQLYNDAYRPVLGIKHPRSMGQPVRDCWHEIWHVLKPLIDTPFRGGPATWMDDIQLEINRHSATAASILAKQAIDIPFAAIYLMEADGQHARLAGTCGIAPGEAMSPVLIDSGHLYFQLLASESMPVIEHLATRFERVPPGPWDAPPRTAIVAPILSNVPGQPAGILVAGVSPRLALDELHLDFFELVAAQLATGIANARAFEQEKTARGCSPSSISRRRNSSRTSVTSSGRRSRSCSGPRPTCSRIPRPRSWSANDRSR